MAEPSFLGRGWAFPPRFSPGGGDVGMVEGVEDVHESLRILLATGPGERIMQESFGCELSSAMFEEVDQGLINHITRLVSNAILDHEPRVVLEGVEVDPSAQVDGLLHVRIDYSIRGTNSRFNMVYPFYLDESSRPGGAGAAQ